MTKELLNHKIAKAHRRVDELGKRDRNKKYKRFLEHENEQMDFLRKELKKEGYGSKWSPLGKEEE